MKHVSRILTRITKWFTQDRAARNQWDLNPSHPDHEAMLFLLDYCFFFFFPQPCAILILPVRHLRCRRFKNLLRAQNWSMTGPTEDWGLLILKENCLAFCDTILASPIFRHVSIICSEKSRSRKVNYLARWSSVMKWQNRGWNSDPRFPPSFSRILSSIIHSTASQGDREDKKEQRGRKPQPKIQT